MPCRSVWDPLRRERLRGERGGIQIGRAAHDIEVRPVENNRVDTAHDVRTDGEASASSLIRLSKTLIVPPLR